MKTVTSTPTITVLSSRTSTPTRTRQAPRPTSTSIYGSPYGSNTWTGYLASLTQVAGSYTASPTPELPTPENATPTLAPTTSAGTYGGTPWAGFPTLSFQAPNVTGPAIPTQVALVPGSGLVPAGTPRAPLNAAPSSQPEQVGVISAEPQAAPVVDAPVQSAGSISDGADETVPLDRAYYARRLSYLGTLVSAILFLAGGALGTAALVSFVTGHLRR